MWHIISNAVLPSRICGPFALPACSGEAFDLTCESMSAPSHSLSPAVENPSVFFRFDRSCKHYSTKINIDYTNRHTSKYTYLDMVAMPNQVGANEVSFQTTPRHTKPVVMRSWSSALVTLPLERKGNCSQHTVVKMQMLKCSRLT